MFNSFIACQNTTNSYKQTCSYSHVLSSKLPPRRVPGTTWYLMLVFFLHVLPWIHACLLQEIAWLADPSLWSSGPYFSAAYHVCDLDGQFGACPSLPCARQVWRLAFRHSKATCWSGFHPHPRNQISVRFVSILCQKTATFRAGHSCAGNIRVDGPWDWAYHLYYRVGAPVTTISPRFKQNSSDLCCTRWSSGKYWLGLSQQPT